MGGGVDGFVVFSFLFSSRVSLPHFPLSPSPLHPLLYLPLLDCFINKEFFFKVSVLLSYIGRGYGTSSVNKGSYISPPSASLLLRDLQTLPQTLNLELLARGAQVDVLDVVRGGLEVGLGVVALGDEDVVLLAVLDRLVQRDRGALFKENAG